MEASYDKKRRSAGLRGPDGGGGGRLPAGRSGRPVVQLLSGVLYPVLRDYGPVPERRWLSGRDLDNLAAKPPVFLPKSSLVRYWEPGEIKKILTSKTRFYIRVLFRQNATWQGSVEWPEGRRRMNFRSALELGEMILEALERMDKPGRWIARPAAEVEKLLRDSRQAGE